MKAVKVEYDSDGGIGSDIIHILDAGIVQKHRSHPRCIIVRAIDDNNHVVGKPIIIDMDIDVRAVKEVYYPYAKP